ncbi:MAG: trypsin-like peptidase domain-containing protein [Candidatus Poribacteria bacterium]|nr:trypsin-like peptidase domain-containing protein [Candidatus Poribacteria bacterium]
MSKKFLFISIFVTAILTLTQFATADYTLTNGRATEPVWATYSVWQPAGSDASGNWWPEGWRTQGWYKIEPSGTITLSVPVGNPVVYIRVIDPRGEVKPPDHAARDVFLFWMHASEAFTAVETSEGTFLRGSHAQWRLETTDFYEYRNGGSHTIAGTPRLPDRPAQHIYDAAIHSVVWIGTDLGNGWVGKGSGVLIDKKRRLVVTNEHVIENARRIYVFFPWQDTNGVLNREEDFYLRNWDRLETSGYATHGRVIAQNVKNDLAIVQLARIPTTAREIQHDFSRNVEDSMRRDDRVHILGNPGTRLWNWTQGTFLTPQQICLPSGGACLAMEGDAEGGNSGGPVLNAQGTLIGILTAGTDETMAAAAPAKNVKALLSRVPANLSPISPQQTYPKRTFKIRNRTGITIPYQIRWSNGNNWESFSLSTGFISLHWSNEQQILSGYPRIRFDHIAGDQEVTYRTYKLESVQFSGNNDHAPIYYFQYNRLGNMLDLFKDAPAAPILSKTAPTETLLLSNYPNPFNPETWIPYQLTKPTEVTVAIYAADGKLVRTLILGHQPAGVYESKSRAAYWDGKNEQGEPVASGLYFYTLKTGDFTATRKMLIRK